MSDGETRCWIAGNATVDDVEATVVTAILVDVDEGAVGAHTKLFRAGDDVGVDVPAARLNGGHHVRTLSDAREKEP